MGARVLLVEDDEVVREMTLAYLREQEIACDQAEDGREALGLLQRRSYDLLLTDINLPGLDGLALVEQANTLAPDMPKVIISASHEIEVALKALRLGAYDFVQKPLRRLDSLGAVVRRALEHRRLLARQRQAEKSIARMNVELARMNAELEQAVRQRTEELMRANRELRTLDEMKNNLLSNISHELRTPLVSVRGYTELFLTGHLCAIPEESRKYLRICLRNIDKLLSLINSLVRYAEMVRDGVELELQELDLGRILVGLLEEKRDQATAAAVDLDLSLPARPLRVRADRRLLTEALRHVLDNAIKFNRTGGEVRVGVDVVTNNLASVSVRDTGSGIPDDAQAKIFERFWQIESGPTRRHGGTGIGLAIARDNLRLLGCELRVRSKLGEGSVFYFTIPCLAREEDGGKALS